MALTNSGSPWLEDIGVKQRAREREKDIEEMKTLKTPPSLHSVDIKKIIKSHLDYMRTILKMGAPYALEDTKPVIGFNYGVIQSTVFI